MCAPSGLAHGPLTHHPWLVEEVVDGLERVEAGDAAVVQPEDDVPVVLDGVLDVLPHQHEVGLERPATGAGKTQTSGRLRAIEKTNALQRSREKVFASRTKQRKNSAAFSQSSVSLLHNFKPLHEVLLVLKIISWLPAVQARNFPEVRPIVKFTTCDGYHHFCASCLCVRHVKTFSNVFPKYLATTIKSKRLVCFR